MPGRRKRNRLVSVLYFLCSCYKTKCLCRHWAARQCSGERRNLTARRSGGRMPFSNFLHDAKLTLSMFSDSNMWLYAVNKLHQYEKRPTVFLYFFNLSVRAKYTVLVKNVSSLTANLLRKCKTKGCVGHNERLLKVDVQQWHTDAQIKRQWGLPCLNALFYTL